MTDSPCLTVSLGYFEQLDLEEALKYLYQDPWTASVGVWGRSMGAVAAILCAGGLEHATGFVDDGRYLISRCWAGKGEYGSKVSCLVLDSPYFSVHTLLKVMPEP